MGLPEEMPSCDFRQAPRGALLCFLLAALLLQVAVGLKCYSYTGSFTGTFSLGPVPTVECGPAQNVCGEGLIRLSIGGPRTATVIHKGCYMAETQDLSSSSQGVNLRSYTHSRLCNQSLCNNRYQNSSHIPAFPTEPPSNASTSLLCYTCIGTTLENCSPSHAEQSHCYHDSARCFNGTFTATIVLQPLT
ncbi:ly6/PLAUR domain-containing protein 5-like isoform X2 [Carettochelys insculpta]|uniref:ly6/PLAUR domain-containing protein 5-like isoform X2 n=1 Tax=Carettochelys insculpta TaxID=44489 RepID=UPI003EB970DD